VELLGQGAQALGEQTHLAGLDGQFAGLCAEQGADHADDVAAVPVFEVGVDLFAHGVLGHVDLDAAGQVLDGDEGGLAHDPLEHDAARHLHFHRGGFQGFAVLVAVDLEQLAGGVLTLEVVRVGSTGFTPFAKLGAAFGDDVVFVLGKLVGWVCLGCVGHGGLSCVAWGGATGIVRNSCLTCVAMHHFRTSRRRRRGCAGQQPSGT